MALQTRWGIRIGDAQLCQGLAHAGALGGTDVAEQQVLIGGKTNLQLIGLHQLPQTRLQLPGETTAEEGKAHEPFACLLAMPAEVVLQLCLRLQPQPLDRMGEVLRLELLPEPADALVVDQIFHPRMAACLAVAVVALERDDRLNQIEHMLRCHVAERIGGAGEGLLLVVGAAHTSAYVDIAAFEGSAGIGEGHQADVLGQQVHGIVTGNGDSAFELARHVCGAVKGFLAVAAEQAAFALAFAHLLHRRARFDAVGQISIDPEIEIRALGSLGGEQIGDVVGQLTSSRVGPFLERSRRCHHVAVDIAAGGQGGAHTAHDRADHLAQVLLAHAMQLEGLAGGGAHRAVAQAVGQFIQGQVEGGGDTSARAAQAQHHLPILVLTLLAVLAIVLLVAAVELQQLNGTVGEVVGVVGQFLGEGIVQVGAVRFELLELAAFGTGCDAGRQRPRPSSVGLLRGQSAAGARALPCPHGHTLVLVLDRP